MAEVLPGSAPQIAHSGGTPARGGKLDTGSPAAAHLVRAAQVAHDTVVRQSANGVRFATFGETGLADLDLDRMLEAVPAGIVAGLKANTYYFVPLALRERNELGSAAGGLEAGGPDAGELEAAGDAGPGLIATPAAPEPVMVASAYTDAYSEAAICHRNVELEPGCRGVFISTRLLADRFALSFEFFINVAHAYVEEAGVPAAFGELAWRQATEGVRGETSLDAWETRNLAFGRAADADAETAAAGRRGRGSVPNRGGRAGDQRSFSATVAAGERVAVVDEKLQGEYLAAAFSDALAIYLLSLALDFDYGELRERDYPLLAAPALAARLTVVATLFPANAGYAFAVRYRRRG